MRTLLALAASALAALATTASAQGRVKDGQRFTDGKGTTVTVDVVDVGEPGKVDVQFIDHTGFTSVVKGTKSGTNGTTYTPAATTISASPNSYRVRDPIGLKGCTVEIKVGTIWVRMKPLYTKSAQQQGMDTAYASGGIQTGIGQQGGSLPDPRAPKSL